MQLDETALNPATFSALVLVLSSNNGSALRELEPARRDEVLGALRTYADAHGINPPMWMAKGGGETGEPMPVMKGSGCAYPVPRFMAKCMMRRERRELMKGRTHKYIRRVATGKVGKKGKPVYRYFYTVAGGAGLGHHDEFGIGSKFAMKDEGHKGHFEVVDHHDDDHVTIRHDETGKTHRLHKDALGAILHAEHAEALTADKQRQGDVRERAVRDLHAAHDSGASKATINAARKRAEDAGATHDEVEHPKEKAERERKEKEREDAERAAEEEKQKAHVEMVQKEATEARAKVAAENQKRREEAAAAAATEDAAKRAAMKPSEPKATRAESGDDIPEHEEVGEHVGGSRADKAELKRLTERADVATSPSKAKPEKVTKDTLFVAPTEESEQELGGTPGSLHIKKWLRATIAAKPDVKNVKDNFRDLAKMGEPGLTKFTQAMYEDGCRRLAKAFANCKTSDEVYAAVRELRDAAEARTVGETYKTLAEAEAAGRAKLPPGCEYSGYSMKYDSGVRGGMPTGYQPNFRNRTQQAIIAGEMAAMGPRAFDMFFKGKTSEAAQTAFREGRQKDKAAWADTPNAQDRLDAKRNKFRWLSRDRALDRQGGRPVTKVDGAVMAKEFGNMPNIQYGNWMSNDDRHEHLQGCHGALYDLADMLGVPDELISLNGRMSIAFGGRGSGGKGAGGSTPVAHYESDAHIINMTKFAGGGSLAHEWGHFMDNIVAKASSTHKGPKEIVMSGGKVRIDDDHEWLTMGKATGQPPQVQKALDAYGHAIMGELGWARFKRTGDCSADVAGASQYLRDATSMSPYHADPKEMFARAFESYIEDQLHESGRVSTYLVHGTRDTYETGEPAMRDPGHVNRDKKAANRAALEHPAVKALDEKTSAAKQNQRDVTKRVIERLSDGKAKANENRNSPSWGEYSDTWVFRAMKDPEWKAAHAAVQQAENAAVAEFRKHQVPVVDRHDGSEHPDMAQPYPQGKERQQINAAIRGLLTALKDTQTLQKAMSRLGLGAALSQLVKGKRGVPLTPAEVRQRQDAATAAARHRASVSPQAFKRFDDAHDAAKAHTSDSEHFKAAIRHTAEAVEHARKGDTAKAVAAFREAGGAHDRLTRAQGWNHPSASVAMKLQQAAHPIVHPDLVQTHWSTSNLGE